MRNFITALTVAAWFLGSVTAATAQTPTATPSTAVNPTAIPSASPTATAIPAQLDELRLHPTLVVEASPLGVEQIPVTAIIRVRTDTGTCLELAVPESVLSLTHGGSIPLPDIVVPAAQTKANCGVPGKPVGFEIVLPDGRTIILLVTTWSPGTSDVVFTVHAPIAQPTSGTPVPSLPATGVAADGDGSVPWGFVAVMLASLALGSALIRLARRDG